MLYFRKLQIHISPRDLAPYYRAVLYPEKKIIKEPNDQITYLQERTGSVRILIVTEVTSYKTTPLQLS